jgi:isoquinoline 1-oxidoreductase beta subunit
MTVPEKLALKRPTDFKLIDTSAKRLDALAKVNGRAVYGIDVRPPGASAALGTRRDPRIKGPARKGDRPPISAVASVVHSTAATCCCSPCGCLRTSRCRRAR